MGIGCHSKPKLLDSVSGIYSPTPSPDSGISNGNAAWEQRLVKLIGLDPTSVLREFPRSIGSICVNDPDDPSSLSDDDPVKIMRKTVAQLANLCSETHTFGELFVEMLDQHRDAVMEEDANDAVPMASITRVPKLFKMACRKSRMIQLKTDTGAPILDDEEITSQTQCDICSATFHLMQFTSQDVLSYAKDFLSNIMALPGISIYNTTDWKVEISLVDIDVNALQGSKQTEKESASQVSDHSSPKSVKKAIMIRHEKTSVFEITGQDESQAPEFQLTWEVVMYIDQEVLEQNYAAFQCLTIINKPQEVPKSPSEQGGACRTEDGNLTAEGGADAGSDPQHDAPSEEQQAQEKEEVKEADKPESIPAEPSTPPKKTPRLFLSRDGITTQQQTGLIQKELIHCDAKIIKVVMGKLSRTLTGEDSKCKKTKQELVSILKKCYDVNPVIVDKLEL